MVDGDPNKRYFSEKEAADFLGITQNMLMRRRLAGKIDHIKDGRLVLYERSHLDGYLNRHSTMPVVTTPEEAKDLTPLLSPIPKKAGRPPKVGPKGPRRRRLIGIHMPKLFESPPDGD